MPDLEDVDVTEQLIEEEQGTRISISDITESDPGPRPEPEELVIKPKSSQEEGIFSSSSKFQLDMSENTIVPLFCHKKDLQLRKMSQHRFYIY